MHRHGSIELADMGLDSDETVAVPQTAVATQECIDSSLLLPSVGVAEPIGGVWVSPEETMAPHGSQAAVKDGCIKSSL
jgi:hypothetical protein